MKKSVILGVLIGLAVGATLVYAEGFISVKDSPTSPSKNTLYKDNIISGWVRFKGNDCTGGTNNDECVIQESFNVEKVVRISTGEYKVYWENDFDNATYGLLHSSHQVTSSSNTGTGNGLPAKGDVIIYSVNSGVFYDSEMTVMAIGGN